MSEQLVIGDFRGTPETAGARERPVEVVDTTPGPELVDVEKAIETVKQAIADEDGLSLPEKYARRLKEANISPGVARDIFNRVLSDGHYEEVVRVGPIRAALRTRLYEDTLRLQRALEMEKPQLLVSQEELVTRYNMAASLYAWNGKAVPHDTDVDFEKALKIVRNLPAPVYTLLARELFKFDQKIMAVFGEGAVESFS